MKHLEEKEFEREKETFAKGVVFSFLKIQRTFFDFKIFFLCALFTAFFLIPLGAENMQIVFPKTAFTGDTVEIKYIFHSEAEIVPHEAFKISPKFALRNDYEIFSSHSEDFFVKEIFLERLSSDYTLTLKIVPWKPGNLLIPAFNLASLARFSIEKNQQENYSEQNSAVASVSGVADKTDETGVARNADFIINLKPVLINSIAEKYGAQDFQPQSPPKTMPGTTAYLALTFAFYLIFAFALTFVILKLPATAKIIKKMNYLLSLKKNSRKAAKKLKKLLKSSPEIQDDKDFAQKFQRIMRVFLSKRFSHDFSSVLTSEIYSVFLDFMGGGLSENQENAVEILTELFFRTDFVRYSPNQNFLENERAQIISKALSLLLLFDSDSEEI